jgi:hypothetical protein
MGVNIDNKLLNSLQSSTCFGIAHDETVPECKQCDVKGQCKAKTEGVNIPTPRIKTTVPNTNVPNEKKGTTSTPVNEKKGSTTTVVKPKPTPKSTASTNPDMPDFKAMPFEELATLATARGVDWKDYGNENINRMRIIMGLKKTY